MESRDAEILAEIWERIQILQDSYSIYRSAIFRAVVQHRDGAIPFANVQASIRLSLEDPVEGGDLTRRLLLEPDLYVWTAKIALKDLARFASEMVSKGTYGFGPEHRRTTVSLDIPEKTAAGFRDPVLLDSREFEWVFGEVCGGVVYYLNAGRNTADFGITDLASRRLGMWSYLDVLWYNVVSPRHEIPQSPPRQGTTGVYVILPNYHGRLEQVILEGRRVRARIAVESAALKDFRLVLVAYGSSTVRPQQEVAYAPAIFENLESREVEHTYETAPHWVKARLYWNPGKSEIQRFVDEPAGIRPELVLYPQLEIHGHFDPRFGALQKAMLSERKDSRDFEWAIATLLTLAGFHVHWLGYMGSAFHQGEPDIIAYLPEQRKAIVAECTVKGGDIGRKIADLVEKSDGLKKILNGWELKKVLFTTNITESVVQHETAADQMEIALVTREVLPHFMRSVQSAVPASLLWDRLNRGVHKAPDLLPR